MPNIDSKKADAFVVRFWGVRGSYPVPGPSTVRYGGNTPCVELQVGNHTIILDAGTGIIGLGKELVRRSRQNNNKPIVATILLSHMHHDHTQGFPFFAPAHLGSSILYILGPHTFERKLEESLRHVVLTPNFPVSLQELPSFKIITTVREPDTLILDQKTLDLRIYNIFRDTIRCSPDTVRVHIHKSYAHPINGVYIYRVEWKGKSVVFASDTEGYIGTDRGLVNFARHTDLLIHDAHYTEEDYVQGKQGWGHSTAQMACDVAHLCGAKKLVLFHHHPEYDDAKVAQIEREAQQRFPNTVSAYEVMEIVL